MGFFWGIIILILGLLSVGAIVYSLSRLWKNWAPGNKRIRKEVEKFRSKASQWLDKLVPWERSEMELFSLNNEILHKSSAFGKRMEGIFKSIYHEPMFYYSYREYLARKRNAILYIRTSQHEFLYRIKKNRIGVFLNDEPLGWISRNRSALYDRDEEQLLAEVHVEGNPYRPVLVEGREVAHLANPKRAERINPRAFSLLDRDLSDQQEALLLCLSSFHLVEHQLEKSFNRTYGED